MKVNRPVQIKAFAIVGHPLVSLFLLVTLTIVIVAFLKFRELAQKNKCLMNMNQIEAAVDRAAQELNLSTGATVSEATIDEYIKGNIPSCPAGGEYTYPPVGSKAYCTSHGTIRSVDEE